MALFADPVAQVVIRNDAKVKEWKWDSANYPFLTGVTIMYESKRLNNVSISIDAPYDVGIRDIMTSPSPFAVGNLVQARIGYASGSFTDWAVGHLIKGGAGISIDANGVSGTVDFTPISKSAFYSVPKDIPQNGTMLDLLRFIADNMGLTLSLGPNAQEVVEGHSLDSEYIFYSSASLSNTVFGLLRKICDEENLSWIIGPDPFRDIGDGVRFLTIISDKELYSLARENVRRKYIMRGIFDLSKNQYPLLSWSPEGESSQWLAESPDPSANGVGSYSIDPDFGTVEEISWLPEDSEKKMTGVLPDAGPEDFASENIVGDKTRQDEPFGEVVSVPVKPGEGGKKRAEKKIAQKVEEGNAAQVGVISTIGIPEEKCMNLCEVIGCGGIYDGIYEIWRQTHTWGPGTYDMSLTVRRSGTVEKTSPEQKETKGGQVK